LFRFIKKIRRAQRQIFCPPILTLQQMSPLAFRTAKHK
jgi:hypothetical protein